MYLVLCPLEKELKHLLLALEQNKYQCEKMFFKQRPVYFQKELGAYFAVGGHGKVQFALNTQFFLTHIPEIRFMICAGAAGGLCSSVDLLHVVAATETIEHDYQLKFDKDAALPRFKGDEALLQRLKQFNGPRFKIHQGFIASGDEDIVDPERSQEIFEKTQALAVAWEGAGGAKACLSHKVPFLELRAITDDSKHSVTESFFKNLPIALGHLATALIFLISSEKK